MTGTDPDARDATAARGPATPGGTATPQGAPSTDGGTPVAGTPEDGEAATGSSEVRERMTAALGEIRREGWKVAAIYAVVDAALVALLVNLVIGVVEPDFLPPSVTFTTLAGLIESVLPVVFLDPSVETAAIAGVVAGLLVLAGEAAWRVRRPLVEQFEAVNPEVSEALRTARDAVEDGAESRMALRLYEDVLDRLKRTSSVGLVDVRRVGVTVVLVLVVSLASIQVAVVDPDLNLFDGPEEPTDRGPRADRTDRGLQSGDQILGETENVSAGDNEIQAQLSSEGGGEGEGTGDPDSYNQGGFPSAAQVESQQAGFAESEQLEDAELIREYNLQIRDVDEEDDS